MSRAVEIIERDPTLLTAFLLRHPTMSHDEAFTDARASRFLLWFATEGRHHIHGARFTPEYCAFLADPAGPFPSRLAAYAAASQIDEPKLTGMTMEEVTAWYYGECVTALGLEPFVSPRERALLRQKKFGPDVQPAFSIPCRSAERSCALVDQPQRGDATHLPGVNIIGFADGVMGIGEDSRALARVLDHAGISFSIVSLTVPDRISREEGDLIYSCWRSDRPIFPVNVFAITAFETARLWIEHGANLFEGRYNVGYWPWELTGLPEAWKGAFGLVDEIWASSHFLHDVYSGMSSCDVHHVPPFINPPRTKVIDMTGFGIAVDDFTFLVMFDFNSYIARKNPYAAIAAFQEAFPARSGNERLLIKTVNSQAHAEALATLEAAIASDDRILLVDGVMERSEVFGLIEAVDCFVSLHRAEGFGRVIAEAMLLGTPVVATDWSGNTTYLDHTRGFPVKYRLRPVEPKEYPFWEGSSWAEPSIEDAARQMIQVRNLGPGSTRIVNAARHHVEVRYGLDAAADALVRRLTAIGDGPLKVI